MNRSQKLVLTVAMALFALATLFPHWVLVEATLEKGMGYHFLFSPPSTTYGHYSGCIDKTMLFVVWILIGVLAAGFCFLLENPESEKALTSGRRPGFILAALGLIAIAILVLIPGRGQDACGLAEMDVRVINADEIGSAVGSEMSSQMDVNVTNPELEVHVNNY